MTSFCTKYFTRKIIISINLMDVVWVSNDIINKDIIFALTTAIQPVSADTSRRAFVDRSNLDQ